jgi:sister-chromatid-cohesion protein PDS5
VLVRKETFSRLAEVYRTYASKCCEGIASVDKQLEWIPGKLLRCCYDKDVKEFR